VLNNKFQEQITVIIYVLNCPLHVESDDSLGTGRPGLYFWQRQRFLSSPLS